MSGNLCKAAFTRTRFHDFETASKSMRFGANGDVPLDGVSFSRLD